MFEPVRINSNHSAAHSAAFAAASLSHRVHRQLAGEKKVINLKLARFSAVNAGTDLHGISWNIIDHRAATLVTICYHLFRHVTTCCQLASSGFRYLFSPLELRYLDLSSNKNPVGEQRPGWSTLHTTHELDARRTHHQNSINSQWIFQCSLVT